MSAKLTNLEGLKFEDLDGIGVSRVEFNGCEAKVMHYKAGHRVPKHHHTDDTLKIVLRGRIQLDNGEEGGAGSLYWCSAESYSVVFVEETYLLLLQKPGTTVVRERSNGQSFALETNIFCTESRTAGQATLSGSTTSK